MKNYIYWVGCDYDYSDAQKVITVTTDLRLALIKSDSTDKELHIWLDNEELYSIDGSFNPHHIKDRFVSSSILEDTASELVKEAIDILDEYYVTYATERINNEQQQAELIKKTELEQLARLKAKYEN